MWLYCMAESEAWQPLGKKNPKKLQKIRYLKHVFDSKVELESGKEIEYSTDLLNYLGIIFCHFTFSEAILLK